MAIASVKASPASRASTIRAASGHGFGLALACLISYWVAVDGLSSIHSLSPDDDLLGGMWAVIATVFVYRETHRQNVAAALTRSSATLISFALCLTYLALFSFDPIGLAAVIGLGTFGLIVIGRADDVVTTGITSAVVLIVAAITPHDVWQQAVLRIFDTAVGIAVGVCASWIALRVAAAELPRSEELGGPRDRSLVGTAPGAPPRAATARPSAASSIFGATAPPQQG
jgi:uncharacterized membrane protein YccC